MQRAKELSRGAVVLVEFPNADNPDSKARPAIHVTDPRAYGHLQSGIFVYVTTQEPPSGVDFIRVAEGSSEARQMGLSSASFIVPHKIVNIAMSLVRKHIGSTPPATMENVDALLRKALGL